MKNTCECCGRLLQDRVCSYCGFVRVVAVDEAGKKFNRQRVKEHTQQLVSSLEKISIVAYAYRANAAGTEMEPVEKRLLAVCSGKDCLDKLVWAPYKFGHQSLGSGNKLDFKLLLSFKSGDAQEVACSARPPVVEDFWRMGVRLTKQLELEVMFGLPENHVTISNGLKWPAVE